MFEEDFDCYEFDMEPDYYDPTDHACKCESEYGCSECNPDNLPTYK
ncbi:hypothetical protein vBVpaMR16F_9 [Vibrio phage vB_VpaM_R16F]|nr:hypothetical protein vBVpaMR16F_9 [Vibrio phage vB_VpaM_R16F]